MTESLEHRASYRRVTLLVVLAALGVGVLDAAQFKLTFELRGDHAPRSYVIGSQFLPWVWLAALLPGVIWAATRWPLDEGRVLPRLPIHLVAMTAFALLHVAGAVFAGVVFSRNPALGPGLLLAKLLPFRFPIDAMAYWAAVGAAHGARAAARAREREQAAARLESRLTESRLAALRDRLNPHFLFNTLNAVTTQALRRDHDGVIRTVRALSDLLRVTLDERKGQLGTVEAELAFLDRYLEIEQLRFGDRLALGREVAPETVAATIPTMLLQPLVENAIRHGIAVQPGPGRVDVRVRREGDELVVEIADTGPGFGANGAAPVKPLNGTGIGLDNTRDRLAALFRGRASLDCRNRPGGGAIVTVRLPFEVAA